MYYKITLLLSALCLANAGYSQKTQVGITGGITIANMKVAGEGRTEMSASKTGFTAGVVVQTPLGSNVMFMPSVNFVQKGFTEPGLAADEVGNTTLNYLELPLNVVYTNSGFFIGGGPAMSFGLSGKTKSSGFDGNIEEDKITFGSGQDEIKQLEFSGNLLAGYQFKNGIMLSVNYNIGFSNLLNTEEDVTLKNQYWGFKVGYVFGKK